MTVLSTAQDLVEAGLISGEHDWVDRLSERYAIGVPAVWVPHIADTPGLARQVIPDALELIDAPAEQPDPIGDDPHSPLPGLVHRYPDRVLMKIVSVCALYCRFCFRRARVGPGQGAMTPKDIDAALAYIASDPGVWEVILSGGDPLMLPPAQLSKLIEALAAIDHVNVVRLHSRIPVAAPERVTPELASALSHPDVTTLVAVHSNHPDEFTPAAAKGLDLLAHAGLPLLGQSVLLKGVNADAETLEALFRTMVRHRVIPYYLHHPDLAPGTGHFRLSIADGQALMRTLRGRVSGIALPTYMLDIPGGYGKVPVGPVYTQCGGAGPDQITDIHGEVHAYPPEPLHD